jgi:acetyl esterase/lipase
VQIPVWFMMASMNASATDTAIANSPAEQPLYPDAIPGAVSAPDEERVRDPAEPYPFLMDVSHPTLTAFLPSRRDANRAAVIILPGGGYRGVSIVKEGHDVARAFNAMGIAAFVLKYRTPSATHMTDRARGPLQDAQQAIHQVREHARDWNIDPARIGVMGFSAGGHLAATLATHFDKPVLQQWSGANLRPDFLLLIYPVISFSPELGHAGSRQMLLGDAPSAAAIREYSNELQVTARTPRSFIVHAADDATVPVGNSIAFFQALHAFGTPAELLIFPAGGHGFGLINATTGDRWMERCRDWLLSQGILSADPRQ